jgi:hypothetical protein
MSSKRLIAVAVVIAGCVAAAAFTGLPWAAASPRARVAGLPAARNGKVCGIKYDSDDSAGCLPNGPRGKRGQRGRRGPVGVVGVVGPVGSTGPVGPVGLKGALGAQGIQGVKGAPGAFVTASGSSPGGSDPGGNTVVVIGSKIGPITIQSGPATGEELTPSVARCPTSGPDQEAYDGGATITTSGSGDVIGLENAYPGLYSSAEEVDPLPLGATPGAKSSESANAYEAQAVITEIQSGQNLTVQAYVVCGP